ncbi:hypothetical protein K438DRAFT_1852603 [Mycena galopus ATCC 62051]|nr:hypothetical protein K438DRAFT_1900039 [Mycena galopus ATCC 62051]KAF8171336.1 hypothetical protein K438DRAFT_1852603 [Mycena galopus ATCC 62051]
MGEKEEAGRVRRPGDSSCSSHDASALTVLSTPASCRTLHTTRCPTRPSACRTRGACAQPGGRCVQGRKRRQSCSG